MSRKRIALAALAGGLALVAVVGGFAAGALVARVRLGLVLSDQPASLRLTEPLRVRAEVTTPLRITLDGIISAVVPFRQRVALPLRGRYRTDFEVDTEFPIRFEVVYEGTLPIDTMAAIEAKTDFNYNDAKYLRNLAFAAKLPMKLEVPIVLRVPVDQPLRFRYRGPLVVELDQTVEVPIDTTIPAEIRVAKDFVTPVTSVVRLEVAPPEARIPITIDRADLRLPLATLRLETAADPEQPVR